MSNRAIADTIGVKGIAIDGPLSKSIRREEPANFTRTGNLDTSSESLEVRFFDPVSRALMKACHVEAPDSFRAAAENVITAHAGMNSAVHLCRRH